LLRAIPAPPPQPFVADKAAGGRSLGAGSAGAEPSSSFKAAAGGDGVKQQVVGCLATEREVYNDLPPLLRWGDFEDIKLGTFEAIRDAFAQVANAPVALEGAVIEVADE
jgi:hypothetical protein